MPLNLVKKLDSMGIEKGTQLKVECNAPYKICDEFALELYRSGYGVSMENGDYTIKVGPVQEVSEGSFLLRYKITEHEDSVFFISKDFDIRRENMSKKGILSGLIFILTGYLLFFVIK